MPEFTKQELFEIGKRQRRINLIFLSLLILVLVSLNIRTSYCNMVIVVSAQIIIGIFAIFQVFYLAKALKYPRPWLWIIGMFVPVIKAICLLAISHNATKTLKANGVKVGIMGPDKNILSNLSK